jgi:predicted alpha/beta-hydrolase family hydrolase
MLFVQGTRDPFASVDEIRELRRSQKLAGALHVVEGGDHSFALPKSQAGRQQAELDGAADAVASFVRKVMEARGKA